MRLPIIFAATLGIAGLAFAADSIGTVSSSAPFELSGVAMRADGVSSWPIVAGDEVRSINAPVIIRFQDGSRITISEQSRLVLVRTGSTLSANLMSGQAQFNLTQESSLQVFNLGWRSVARSGSISTRSVTGGAQVSGPRAEVSRIPPPPVSTK